jgi:membrane protease YdiL (CAAX protease family)
MSKDSSKSDSEMNGPGKEKWFKRFKKTDLGSPWWVVFNVLAIFFISQVLAALIVQLGLNVAKLGSDSIENSTIAQFSYVLIAELVAVGFVFYILKSRKLSFGTIGLGRLPNRKDLYKAGLGFMAFFLIIILVSALLSQIFPDLNNGEQDVGFNNLRGNWDVFIALFALVLLPPIGEEILVRGYLFSGLRSRMKFIPAMIITSLIFGAAHLQTGADPGVLWAAGLNTFVLSIVLVYLRQSTGALYAGMMIHMFNNLIAFGVHYQ